MLVILGLGNKGCRSLVVSSSPCSDWHRRQKAGHFTEISPIYSSQGRQTGRRCHLSYSGKTKFYYQKINFISSHNFFRLLTCITIKSKLRIKRIPLNQLRKTLTFKATKTCRYPECLYIFKNCKRFQSSDH